MIARLLNSLAALAGPEARPEPRRSDAFADVPLANHLGERLRFRGRYVDGRALIVNTMFAACKGTCPGTSHALRKLREALTPVFGERLTIVSITLEPADDTPAVLRRYAEAYGAGRREAGRCGWEFVTGRPVDVERLRRSLGFYDLDPRVDADVTQHAELLLFGNSTGDRWSALPASLRAPLLVEAVRRVAGFTFEQKYGIRA